MQDKDLYEYAVVRVVPKVEREEFLNVGIILYCPSQKFLGCRCIVNEERFKAFSPEVDMSEIRENLEAMEKICSGSKNGGPIGKLDIASRFRWLTAARSTMVQTSRVHPGLSKDAKETLEKLFREIVL